VLATLLSALGCSRDLPTSSSEAGRHPTPGDRAVRSIVAEPIQPDRHELSYYTDVDLLVSRDDFDRLTSPLATFETDANLQHQAFAFDLSGLVTPLGEARIGFRVKLEADPGYTAFGFLGSGFDRYSTPCGARIEVLTTRAEANDRLQEIVREMSLPPTLEVGLLGPLHEIERFLRDDNPHNDRAACGRLQQFIDAVRQADRDLELSAPQAWDLEELARNLMTSIGCAGGSTPSRPGPTPAPVGRERG
jgi:hypothetical protein